ncbi:DUF7289 family protein [Halorussus halobius]|uniref:DUF7289 family protein n=1 Tax=Halorussus halobius TaxID=1710537 RepID=UPI001092CFB6|nr:hypothetical protein [Halorussus halobius]
MSRGVSHVVGYVLVFAVVMASVGVLYGSGVGSLEGVRDAEQVDNAERAVVALAQNFAAVDRGRAPGRAGEVRLGGGRLAVEEATEFRVTVERGGDVVQQRVGVGALVYEYDDTEIRYEAGGVFRTEDGGSVLARRPAFDCAPDRALVSTVSLRRAGDTGAVAEDGTVVVVGRRAEASTVFPRSATPQGDEDATVRFEVVSSPSADAWGRYLTDSGWSRSGDVYECSTDRAFVRRTILDVAIRT